MKAKYVKFVDLTVFYRGAFVIGYRIELKKEPVWFKIDSVGSTEQAELIIAKFRKEILAGAEDLARNNARRQKLAAHYFCKNLSNGYTVVANFRKEKVFLA